MRQVIRSEIKHLAEKNDYYKILKLIKKIDSFEIYPTRAISSIYFDNSDYKSFVDSEEGLVPRKKIRIRTYNNFNSIKEIQSKNLKFNFETKIAEKDYDKKISYEIKDPYNLINNGFHDKEFGNCSPIVKVRYLRDYFIFKQSIITLDYNIQYSTRFQDNFINFTSPYIVLEFKNNSKFHNKILFETLGLKSIRFSKYSMAVNQSIKLLN
tara:strand:- start:90 stop:719 length:630 start_codon:yes stop_codon:yes gene_type:complete